MLKLKYPVALRICADELCYMTYPIIDAVFPIAVNSNESNTFVRYVFCRHNEAHHPPGYLSYYRVEIKDNLYSFETFESFIEWIAEREPLTEEQKHDLKRYDDYIRAIVRKIKDMIDRELMVIRRDGVSMDSPIADYEADRFDDTALCKIQLCPPADSMGDFRLFYSDYEN